MKYLLLLLSLQAFGQGLGPNVSSARNVYSTTNVGTSTPVTLIKLTQQRSTSIGIFDSSGNTMELVVTGAGGGIDYLIIPPGGGTFLFPIGKGALVQVLGVSGSASAGE